MDFTELFEHWDNAQNEREFVRYLKAQGWNMNGKHGGSKRVFEFGQLVLKFDHSYNVANRYEFHEAQQERSHTASEYRQYRRARGLRKRYIVQTIAYHRGLLIQPLLSDVCEDYYCPHTNARRIASRLRFSHWWHHGWLDGKLKFFDTDSAGSGWQNWKRKRASRREP